MFWITLLWLVVAAHGATYEQLFAEAGSLSARGDYAAAAQRYEAALALRPGAPEALSNLGVMYYMAERYGEAEHVMEKVLRTRPSLTPASLIRGLALVRLGRYDEAVAPLERVLAAEPGHRDALLGLAGARVAQKDYEQAAALYRQQTSRAPRDADAWHALALCYERMAEAQSRLLSRMENGAAYSKRFLGEYWLERGQNRLAQEALAEALVLDPQQPGLAALLEAAERGEGFETVEKPEPDKPAARAYLEARRLAAQSRTAFARFVEIAPGSWQAHLLLGDLSRQRRDFPAAIQHYEAAARLQPENPAPLLGLGTAYWELGNDEQAIAFLQKVLQKSSGNPQALFALGNIAVKQRRDADAIELLEKCLRVDPDHLGAHADIGKAYLHLGRAADAAPHLERARAIDTYGDIHFQLATALRKMGRTGDAREALERSSQIRREQREREQRLRLGRN
ncbi:MAG: tetratricopeptide repeat protein [Bryobacteraceae bacterium]